MTTDLDALKPESKTEPAPAEKPAAKKAAAKKTSPRKTAAKKASSKPEVAALENIFVTVDQRTNNYKSEAPAIVTNTHKNGNVDLRVTLDTGSGPRYEELTDVEVASKKPDYNEDGVVPAGIAFRK